MDRVIPLLTLVAILIAWTLLLDHKSRGRAWSPLWAAFGTSTGAALFLMTGILGYRLGRHGRFAAGAAWSQDVIWPQVWIGVAMALAALYFWRRGLRSLRP